MFHLKEVSKSTKLMSISLSFLMILTVLFGVVSFFGTPPDTKPNPTETSSPATSPTKGPSPF